MPILPAEIERRLTAFQQALRAAAIDCALLIEASGLVYLTGVMADAHLLVPADGEPILLVRRSLERVQADSPLEDVRPFRSFKELSADPAIDEVQVVKVTSRAAAVFNVPPLPIWLPRAA